MPVKTYFGPVQDLEKQIARCSKCEEWKPLSEFSPERPGKKRVVQSCCKPCACNDWRKRQLRKGAPISIVEVSDFKKCDHCGLVKPITEMVKKRKRSKIQGVRPMCLDCDRIKCNLNYSLKRDHVLLLDRKRRENPVSRAKRLFNGIRGRAKEFGMEFNLTSDWIEKKCVDGVCEVTGIEFVFSLDGVRRNLFAPSVDRVDSRKGYTKDNCKLVLLGYNLAKSDSTHEDVVRIARGLVDHETRI